MADEMIGQTKVCTKCGVAKAATLDAFSPHKLGRFGLHPFCRQCKRADDAERRGRPDQKARQKAWRDANKDYVKSYNDGYRADNPSTQYVAKWRAKNIDHARASEARRMRDRRAADAAFRLKCRVSSRLRMMLTGKAGRTTESLLGYSAASLKTHIERQFTRGMTWAAVFRGEIHIDHIVPVSAFRIETAEDADFKVCWGLPNLRPMWAKDNQSKGGKRLTLL
jgi:hypothetical protein